MSDLRDHPKRASLAVHEPYEDRSVRFEAVPFAELLDVGFGALRGVDTTAGRHDLDVLVLAAGVQAPGLARQAGVDVPLVESPGILAHSVPTDPALGRILLAPEIHAKQTAGGRVVAGVGFAGAGSTDASMQVGRDILETTASVLPAARGLDVEEVTLGYRVLPRDGHPIVGFDSGAPGIYFASMHSGVTMAPVMGMLAAMEILDDVEVSLLDDYRLGRFR